MDSDNPYAAPKATVDVAGERGQLASRSSRLGAALLDMLINCAIFLPISCYVILPQLIGQSGYAAFKAIGHADSNTQFWYRLSGTVISTIVFFLLNAQLLHTRGQTIGKRALGIRIVHIDGNPTGPTNILVRYGIFFGISYIPMVAPFIAMIDLLCIFRKSHQCLHDSIADTIVVKA